MRELDKKKKQVELMKVEAGKASNELLILERLEDIERIKKEIEIQDKKIDELKEVIANG